jgi:hypothetical protein
VTCPEDSRLWGRVCRSVLSTESSWFIINVCSAVTLRQYISRWRVVQTAQLVLQHHQHWCSWRRLDCNCRKYWNTELLDTQVQLYSVCLLVVPCFNFYTYPKYWYWTRWIWGITITDDSVCHSQQYCLQTLSLNT